MERAVSVLEPEPRMTPRGRLSVSEETFVLLPHYHLRPHCPLA